MGQVPGGAVTLVSSVKDVSALQLEADVSPAYAVQTTFAVRDAWAIVAAVHDRFGLVAKPRSGNICYATTNRQIAIEVIAARADYVLVVGDRKSSNANRLVEIAAAAGGIRADLVNGQEDLDWEAVMAASTIGMTAAASTPDTCVEDVCNALAEQGFMIVEEPGTEENVAFKPARLD
jgi:4-hydroxy-3-methylbut-2-enyl diphosphate reductase